MTWTYRFQEAEIDGLYLANEFYLNMVSHQGKWRIDSAFYIRKGRRATTRELALFAIWLDDPAVQAQLTTEHDEEQAERTR